MFMTSSIDAANRWTSRVIPLILFTLIAIATYVVTKRICVDILIPQGEHESAVAILVLLYIFFTLTIICYVRTIYTVLFNPGVVPLVAKPSETTQQNQKEGYQYDASSLTEQGRRDAADRMTQFWTKDVFQCTDTGMPRWCSKCQNWKPDRSHHSKELARCVRKMDHFCPWMGGIIAETSFKFFIQFNIYASCFCAVCFGTSAYAVHKQVSGGLMLDPWILIILGLGVFFWIFTITMGTNSMRYAYLNLTTVDSIGSATCIYYLAVRVSRSVPPSDQYRLVTYPTTEATVPVKNIHTFAVVKTKAGENPWDLGYIQNWKSIMGNSVIDWFLPIRLPPETSYDSIVSDYPLGEVYSDLRTRYNLSPPREEGIRKHHRKRRKHSMKLRDPSS